MDPITVYRHGDRWAVQEDPDTAPTAEYETREEAEMAARQAAGDREVVVRDDTGDADLGHGGGTGEGGGVRDADAAIDRRTAGAGARDEAPREPQAGM